MESNKDTIVSMENVHKKYPGFELKNITINLQKGHIVGIIGENGSGKSTIIKLIAGIINADEGKVRIFGSDVHSMGKKEKEKIGFLFSEYGFDDSYTGKEISNYMKWIYKDWDEEAFSNYLIKFGVPINKQIKKMSKGMKMKLLISCTLVHKAEILIMDEPTNALDPIIRDDILNIIVEYVEENNCTVLLTSHVTTDIEKIAGDIIFLNNGNIIYNNRKEWFQRNFGILHDNSMKGIDKEKIKIEYYMKDKNDIKYLISNKEKLCNKYPELKVKNVSLDDISLFIVKGEKYDRFVN